MGEVPIPFSDFAGVGFEEMHRLLALLVFVLC